MADLSFWRELKTDFESLSGEYSLVWSVEFERDIFTQELATSHWHWLQSPNPLQRTHFEEYAAIGACVMFGDDADVDEWLDALKARNIGFSRTGPAMTLPDGSWTEYSNGIIDDVIQASVSLCISLENELRLSAASKKPKAQGQARQGGPRRGQPETQQAVAERRHSIIKPLLDAHPRGWSVLQWLENADVRGKATVYGYWHGTSYPRADNAAKLAKAVGLNELPR